MKRLRGAVVYYGCIALAFAVVVLIIVAGARSEARVDRQLANWRADCKAAGGVVVSDGNRLNCGRPYGGWYDIPVRG